MTQQIDVAVIIVSWNVQEYIIPCIQSVLEEFETAKLTGKIWVIDNHSKDDTILHIKETYGNTVHLIENTENPGFGAANNQGIDASRPYQPRTTFLLNPDTKLYPNSLAPLYNHLIHQKNTGMVGPQLEFGDGSFQHSAFHFPGIWQLLFELCPLPARFYESSLNGRYPKALYQGNTPFPIDHPLGAAMLIRADALAVTKGFDEHFLLYCEEVDWAMRIRKAGWEIETVPTSQIIHYGGQSSGQVKIWSMLNLWESRAKFYRRHYPTWKYTLAKLIAKNRLKKKATSAESKELKDAYQTASHYW